MNYRVRFYTVAGLTWRDFWAYDAALEEAKREASFLGPAEVMERQGDRFVVIKRVYAHARREHRGK